MILLSLEIIKVKVYLFTKYVDDVNLAVSLVPRGWSLEVSDKENRKLMWSEE